MSNTISAQPCPANDTALVSLNLFPAFILTLKRCILNLTLDACPKSWNLSIDLSLALPISLPGATDKASPSVTAVPAVSLNDTSGNVLAWNVPIN